MDPRRAEPAPDSDLSLRLLLAVVAVGVPLFGLVKAVDLPEVEDAWRMRLAISGFSTCVLVGSYRSPWIRARLQTVALVIACWLQGWFMVTGTREGMLLGHVVGLMLITSLAMLSVRTALEVAVFAAFTLSAIVLAYASPGTRAVSAPMLGATLLTLIVGVGGIQISRVRLERALMRSRAELEQRVEERTAELRTTEREARAASQAKSTFLANMSHELRTPLNAIVGYTEMVVEELDDSGQAPLADDLRKVRSSAGHLLRLVDDVLDLTRIESGRLEIRRTEVGLWALVDEVVRGVDRDGHNGNVIDVDVPADLVVGSDRKHLRQIVENLLSNALKFTVGGRVRVEARPTDGGVSLSVSDTGVGIPEEAMGRLFQKFVQVDDSSTRRHGGTGLGLALCRELVTRLDATLAVHSVVGVGSTFTLLLPARSGPT